MWRASRPFRSKVREEALVVLHQCLGLPSPTVAKWQSPHLLQPIFSGGFSFEFDHLSALGESVIRSTVAEALHQFALRNGKLFSQNASDEVMAVFLNHYSLRFIAERIHFLEFAAVEFRETSEGRTLPPPPTSTSGGSAEEDEAEALGRAMKAVLESPKRSPAAEDVKGTSFEFLPLSCGQSPIATNLTHLIGAVDLEFGSEASTRAVDQLWKLKGADVNVPQVAAKLLADVCNQHGHAPVALAILVASGIKSRFSSRSVALQSKVGESGSNFSRTGPSNAANSADSAFPPSESDPQEYTPPTDGPWALATQTPHGGPLAPNTASSQTPKSFEQLHREQRVALWKKRTGATTAFQDAGWIDPSAADATNAPNSVELPTKSFADFIGMPHPPPFGGYVFQRKFDSPISDPRSIGVPEGKEGIEFDTGGLPMTDYLARISQPHHRLFEVRLEKVPEVSGPHSKLKSVLISKGVAPTYSQARVAACSNYLNSLLLDLRALAVIEH
jgi:hypothetical protein